MSDGDSPRAYVFGNGCDRLSLLMADISSAALAAVSALVGAGIGGLSTYFVARQQIEASSKGAERDAERQASQRQGELYADFIASASEVVDYFIHSGRRISIADNPKLEELYGRLHSVGAKLSLTADEPVRLMADAVMAEVTSVAEGSPSAGFLAAQDNLAEAARRELQSRARWVANI